MVVFVGDVQVRTMEEKFLLFVYAADGGMTGRTKYEEEQA